MRYLALIFILFSLFSLPTWSETFDDLVERDGLYYKKFTDTPFTGKITGNYEQGSIKDGKRVGIWVLYYANGQLWSKGEWKNGKAVGEWVTYSENGQLRTKGKYKNGEQVGEWFYYNKNGTFDEKITY